MIVFPPQPILQKILQWPQAYFIRITEALIFLISLIYPLEFPVTTEIWQKICIFLCSPHYEFVLLSKTNG